MSLDAELRTLCRAADKLQDKGKGTLAAHRALVTGMAQVHALDAEWLPELTALLLAQHVGLTRRTRDSEHTWAALHEMIMWHTRAADTIRRYSLGENEGSSTRSTGGQ